MKPGSQRPEDNPFFTCNLTPGELAMFDQLDREEAVHNALGAALGKFKDHIMENRNQFFDELCKKYNITNRSKITFDKRTRRFVSIFSAELMAVRIDHGTKEFTQMASRLTFSCIRELLAIYKSVVATGVEKGN